MNKILDLNNKYIRGMILIIFFAVTLFSASYIIKSVGFILEKLFIWFLPFIIALILSYMLEPYIKKLEKYMDRRISSAIVLLVLNIAIIAVLGYCISRLSSEIIELSGRIPYYTGVIQEKFEYFKQGATRLYVYLPIPVAEFIKLNINKMFLSISEFASKSIYVIKVVPSTFKAIIVWFISSFIAYLILRDREKINAFFKNNVSDSWQDDLKVINTQIIRAVMGFIKSQIILIIVMFIVSLGSLILIGSPYVIIISILAGLFSIIPVIGTGVVFIPFILIKLSAGYMSLGIKLIIVYVITILIREIVVIKVVSENVGLDLLTTIISMYVGIEVFGEFGFVIGPLLFIILKVIYNSSLMDRFKKKFNLI